MSSGGFDDNAVMLVNGPGMRGLRVPLRPPAPGAPQRRVTVWEWSGAAADEGEEAATWFSEYLGIPCRLTR